MGKSTGFSKKGGGRLSIKSGGTTVRVGNGPHRGRAGKSAPQGGGHSSRGGNSAGR